MSTKVALLNPPNTRGNAREEANAVPPLGLASIAALLRASGFPTDLFDLGDVAGLTTEFLRRLIDHQYAVFGITSYTKTFPAAIDLARQLRTLSPEALIVLGGPHVTPCARAVLADHAEVDVVVKNDGEVPMLEICRQLQLGQRDFSGVANVVFRRSRPQEIAESDSLPQALVLDDLPPPARDWAFQPNRYVIEARRAAGPARAEFFTSSRGCPKRCTFCSIIVMNPKYRFRSVGSLMAEIKDVYARNPFGHVAFHDANFFVHTRRTLEFSRALFEWNPLVTWSATATADSICAHENVLAEIASLNCLALEVGIENGSDSVMTRYNKGTTVSHNERAIALLAEHDVILELDYILFDPELSLGELQENLSFLIRNELTGLYPNEHLYNALKLYPGTSARDVYLRRFGLPADFSITLIPPFVVSEVELIYDLTIAFGQRVQPSINKLLVQLDSRARSLVSQAASADRLAAQEMFALAIRLRHFPEHFIEAVTSSVSDGLLRVGERFEHLDLPQLRDLRALLVHAASLLELQIGGILTGTHLPESLAVGHA